MSVLDIVTVLTIGGAIAWAAFWLVETWLVGRATARMPRRAVSGGETLLGKTARVITEFSQHGEGRVSLASETWRARLADLSHNAPARGDLVKIVSIEGLTLRIVKVDGGPE